jgi:hypothetical protein
MCCLYANILKGRCAWYLNKYGTFLQHFVFRHGVQKNIDKCPIYFRHDNAGSSSVKGLIQLNAYEKYNCSNTSL